ncbi:MAG: hypothetical protein HY930_05480, partial [Euryarchaeota archaeon]|nr:hypothetical protein [Euryarchaeota archaeon]
YAVIEINIARPGDKVSHHATSINSREPDSMSPQLGTYGGTPNPKKLKDLLTLLREYEIQMDEYNRAVSQYNALVRKYNAANPITQLSLRDDLNNQAKIVNQELEDVNRVVAKINVLIS